MKRKEAFLTEIAKWLLYKENSISFMQNDRRMILISRPIMRAISSRYYRIIANPSPSSPAGNLPTISPFSKSISAMRLIPVSAA